MPHNTQLSSIDNSDLRYQYGLRVSGTSVGHPRLVYLNTLLKIASRLVAALSCVAVTGKCSSSYNVVIVIGLGSRAYIFYYYRLRCTRVTCFNPSNPC